MTTTRMKEKISSVMNGSNYISIPNENEELNNFMF